MSFLALCRSPTTHLRILCQRIMYTSLYISSFIFYFLWNPFIKISLSLLSLQALLLISFAKPTWVLKQRLIPAKYNYGELIPFNRIKIQILYFYFLVLFRQRRKVVNFFDRLKGLVEFCSGGGLWVIVLTLIHIPCLWVLSSNFGQSFQCKYRISF